MIGLVKHTPNQGVIVQEMSLKKIMEIYELRLSLETFAAKHLIGKMDASFFRQLDDNLTLQEQCVKQEDRGYCRICTNGAQISRNDYRRRNIRKSCPDCRTSF